MGCNWTFSGCNKVCQKTLKLKTKIVQFFFSPLITDPDDAEVLGGHVSPGHEPTKTEGKKKIKSTKEIDSFVCGIQVEDELDAVIENAHKNDDCDSSSGFVDEESCQGMNEEIEVGEISPSPEDAFLFADVEEDLEPALTQESNEEVSRVKIEEEVGKQTGTRKISKEGEINDTRRFEGKLSRQQELRQSENEVGRYISICPSSSLFVQVPKLWSSLDTQSEEMGLGGLCEIAGSKPVCDTVQEYSVTPYPRCKNYDDRKAEGQSRPS